jgi:[ribosomal protein S5]-alanine N-acetyltransferase
MDLTNGEAAMDSIDRIPAMPLAASFGSIRPYAPGDLDALVKHADNRKIWRNMRDGFPSPYTRESGRAFLGIVQAQQPVTFFAIAAPEELIGGIGISLQSDVHRLSAELGYWLGEAHWGRGIITESIRRFTDFAFAQYRLMRIYAEPYADNLGSNRALEKAGFVCEGRLIKSAVKEGRMLDQFLYAKIAS